MTDFKASMKHQVKRALARTGFEVRKVSKEADSMAGAFERFGSRLRVASVIDVGASNGSWSQSVQPHFPDAAYLLIEAQGGPHGDALERLASKDSRVRYVIAAAGNKEGEVHFDAGDPLGGVASPDPTGPHDMVVPMTTVDVQVERLGLTPPYLVKLDTHGFEVPIFEGAEATLAQTELIVVEAYNFTLQPGSLRFHEMCGYLEERGFRCIDLVDVLRRPSDRALWQMDLFFVRADRPEFEQGAYV